MAITTEAREKAQTIIREGLDAHFRGKVSFDSVGITPRSGPDDEDYLDVLVVYSGSDGDLAARLLNSLYERIGDDLRAIGIDASPSISYRNRTESSKLSDPERMRPFGEQG